MSSTELKSPLTCAGAGSLSRTALLTPAVGSSTAKGGGKEGLSLTISAPRSAPSAMRDSCPMPRKLVTPSADPTGAGGGGSAGPSRAVEGLPPRDPAHADIGGGAGSRSYDERPKGSSPRSRPPDLPGIPRSGDAGRDPPPLDCGGSPASLPGWLCAGDSRPVRRGSGRQRPAALDTPPLCRGDAVPYGADVDRSSAAAAGHMV